MPDLSRLRLSDLQQLHDLVSTVCEAAEVIDAQQVAFTVDLTPGRPPLFVFDAFIMPTMRLPSGIWPDDPSEPRLSDPDAMPDIDVKAFVDDVMADIATPPTARPVAPSDEDDELVVVEFGATLFSRGTPTDVQSDLEELVSERRAHKRHAAFDAARAKEKNDALSRLEAAMAAEEITEDIEVIEPAPPLAEAPLPAPAIEAPPAAVADAAGGADVATKRKQDPWTEDEDKQAVAMVSEAMVDGGLSLNAAARMVANFLGRPADGTTFRCRNKLAEQIAQAVADRQKVDPPKPHSAAIEQTPPSSGADGADSGGGVDVAAPVPPAAPVAQTRAPAPVVPAPVLPKIAPPATDHADACKTDRPYCDGAP